MSETILRAMRTYVTSEEMKRLDRLAIEKKGLEGKLLMENAGRGIVDSFRRTGWDLAGESVLVLCGPGNNGGDGFVIARWMSFYGADVRVALVGFETPKSKDAAYHLDILHRLDLPYFSLESQEDLESLIEELEGCDLVVDALFGTGLNKDLDGFYSDVIQRVNQTDASILSVDCPSGLDTDTGEVRGSAVLADFTFTLAFLKTGFLHGEALDLCGEIEVVDIGISEEWFLEEDIPMRRETSIGDLMPLLLPRSLVAHKGSFGHLLILAGSREKSGAAILACEGALHSGVGLATLACPDSAHDMIKSQLTEAMSVALPDRKGLFTEEARRHFLSLLVDKAAVVLGPGLVKQGEIVAWIETILSSTNLPLVLDADALNVLADADSAKWDFQGRVILTPHPGEMARLLGCSTHEVQKNRVGLSQELAARWNCFVLLKGAQSILASPDGEVFINPTGNPSMASGGMGDVLAGMIGASLAKGLTPMMAMMSSAFLHGFAADYLVDEDHQATLLASDVAAAIPTVVAVLQGFELGSEEGLEYSPD